MSSAHLPVQDAPLRPLIDAFLTDLTRENRSPHTRRAYAADLTRFASFYPGPLEALTADVLQSFIATLSDLKPATQARAQAVLASFLAWAQRHEWIAATPMTHMARVRHSPPAPPGIDRSAVEAILDTIPATQRRDQILFRLLAATGLRVSEALALSVEDLDLTRAEAHLHVVASDQRRIIPLNDAGLIAELCDYRTHLGQVPGLLFRAQKNGGPGPLHYQSVRVRWQRYCAQAGVFCTLNQLRSAYRTMRAGMRESDSPPHLARRRQQPLRRDTGWPGAPARMGESPPPQPVDIIGYLRRVEPFQALPDADLAELAALARCKVYRRGELYLDLTESIERFYIVLRGSVGFYRLAPDGHKLTLNTRGEGAVIWVPTREWFDGVKASGEALSDGTVLCQFAMREIRHLMLTQASFAVALFDELFQVAVRLADRLGEWAHGSVVVRLAHTVAMCSLANEQRIVSETHDQLAWLTGASRATVTKELQRLRAMGLIAFRPHHHGIHVPDPERLLTL